MRNAPALHSSVRVKSLGFFRRLLLTDHERSLLGQVGTVGLIEKGEFSRDEVFTVVFDRDGESASGVFFVNELEPVRS